MAREYRDQGEWFRVTLSCIGDAVITTDNQGRVTFLNPAAEQLTGWARAEAEGQPLESVFRIVNEYTRKPVENPVARVLREGTVVGLANHTTLIVKDGSERPIADSAAPIRKDEGEVAGVVLVFRDVSAERRAEEDRRRLAAIVECSDDAILSKTLDGIITSWNRAAERLYGYTAEETIGQHVSMLVPQDRMDELSLIMQKIQRGEATDHFETVRRRKDGSLVEVSVTVSPIADAGGQLVGASTIARSVAERNQAERELRESEERKTAILNTALDCIITMDQQGKIVDFNPAAERTFGYRREEVLGRPLAELIIPPSLRQRHSEGLARYLAGGEGRVLGKRVEMPALHADGSEFPVELAISAIRSSGPLLFTAYLRDLSESKRTESRRAARLAVTHTLSEAPTIAAAIPRLLKTLCEALGWDVGTFWQLDNEAQLLRCSEFWCTPTASVTAFEAETRHWAFTRGVGLPGRIWATSRPAWIPDVVADDNFPRATAADRVGLHAAVGFPVIVGHEFLGVVEFFSHRILEPDDDLLEMMGSISGQIGHFIERQRAELARAESEERFRVLADSAPVLIWVNGLHGCEFVNRAYLEYVGVAPADVRDFDWVQFIHPLDREQYLNTYQAAFAERRPYSAQCRFRRADGEYRWMKSAGAPRFSETGEFQGYVGCTFDVSDIKLAEQTLQASESRFKALASHAPVGIFQTDVAGNCLFVNEKWCELAGITPDDARGGGWINALHPEDRDRVFHEWYSATAAGGQFSSEYRFCTLTGRVSWLTGSAVALRTGDGEVTGHIGTVTDISELKKAEVQLSLLAEELRLLTDALPALISYVDSNAHYRFVNKAYVEWFGRSREDIQGKHVREVLGEATYDRVRPYVDAALAGQHVHFEDEVPHKTGGPRFVRAEYVPHMQPDGSVGGYYALITDITDRKRSEQVLRESEERLRLALDAGRMGTWEWNIATNSVSWSPGLEALHGLRAGTFAGTFEAFQHDIHPDDRDRVLRSIQATLQDGKEHHVEYRILWPNGTQHWVEGRGKLFSDEQGNPLRMIGVCTDIDQRKINEDKTQFLADASETLASLVDYKSTLQKVARLAVPFFADWCAVDMLDDDGKLRRLGVAHVDPAKVELARDMQRRFPPDPDAPQGVWNIIRTGDSEIVPEINDELLESTVKRPELLQILRELGLRSYIGVPLSVRGKVLGVLIFITAESGRRYTIDDLAVAEDLAHRAAVAVENAKLYHALREADRRKDEFLALLGHELRNPLAPISNALHVLKLPQASDTMREQAREMLERQVEHMVRLVDDLLDVSRIMRGKVELRREPVEMAAVVARAVETVQPVIEAEGHRLALFASPEPLWVHGDLVRLAQVLANLLHNAAKYTERGGEITLTTAREQDQAVVRVRDNGIGLAPDTLSRIFEMFFQAERRTKDAHGGLGIGLSLVRSLIESHGGTVEAHSAGLGSGSEFVVRLPLIEHDIPDRAGEPEVQGAAADQLRSQPVLVVDDNIDAADSLAMLLRLLKQDVIVAYDGPAALDRAEANPPAIAFVDLGMPRMDGFEVARRFRENPALTDVVLVAVTGWGQPEDRQRTKENGFDHHIVKPVDADTLRRLLGEQARHSG